MKVLKNTYIVLLALLLVSCDDWLDVNQDPNNPETTNVELLLPGVQVRIFNHIGGYNTYSIGDALGSVLHQINSERTYNIVSGQFGLSRAWESLYVGVNDLEEMIQLGTTEENFEYVGVAKIIKSYIYSVLVDLYGTVPYSEAVKVKQGINYPKYDKGEDIYKQLFVLLEEAKADLKKENKVAVLANGDLVYGGSVAKWEKLANTLLLRLYNNVRLTPLYDATKVNDLLSKNNFITKDDGFEMKYGSSKLPENRNPMYVAEYANAGGSAYSISHWFYHSLTGGREQLGVPSLKGVTDPRVPYYFYKQSSGRDETSEWDYTVSGFSTVRFGSISRNVSSGNIGLTTLGLYACGGKYDEGKGGMVDAEKESLRGEPATAQRLFSYADLLFVRAELAAAGKTSEDAKSLFEQAVNAALDKVDNLAAEATYTKVPAIDATVRADFIKEVLSKYDVASDKLEPIITQKWIAGFGGAAIESYNDFRRTGHPKLYDPEKDDDDPLTISSFKFPVIMPFVQSEVNTNSNVPNPEKRVISEDLVFWDK